MLAVLAEGRPPPRLHLHTRERGGTVKVWTIYRAHCVQCGQVKEFQSEQAARSHIDEHQRGHNNAPINWSKSMSDMDCGPGDAEPDR